MNFIKRTGIILIVIAISASSCNKHSDDFIPIDGYPHEAMRISSVTQLVLDMVALRSAITSTQTSITSLPDNPSTTVLKNGLTAISARIDDIDSTLSTLADKGTTDKAINDSLKNDLTALKFKTDTDDSSLKTQISLIGSTNIVQLARLNDLRKTNASLSVIITNAQKSLDNLKASSGDTATQVAVNILIISMSCAKVSFDILLATYML